MVEIQIRYPGELHCEAHHAPSSRTLYTDAPLDNMGKGESFSPTDLLATALGTCMATTMGILARRKGWNIDGITLRVQKVMTTQPPRKIQRLDVAFSVPESVANALDDDAKEALEAAAETCPVALSLHSTVEMPIAFDW